MWKKITAAVALLFAVVLIATYWLLSSTQLERIANHFLAPDFSLRLAEPLNLDKNGISAADIAFSLPPQACQPVELQGLRLDGWLQPTVSVQKAVLDYACLMQFNPAESNGEKTTPKLTALLALIPDATVEIKQFQLINAELPNDPALQQLLQSDARLHLIKQGSQLKLTAELRDLSQSAVIFRLDLQLDNLLLSGNAYYQPTNEQMHQLDFQFNLYEDPTQFPQQGTVKLNWQRPQFAVKQGAFSLQWQDWQGRVELLDLSVQKELLNLPFTFAADRIQIQKGSFYWNVDEQQPLQGVLNLTLKKTTKDWLPLSSDVRVSLFSSGKQGKGNVVVYGSGGFIGKERIYFPLEAHGNIKYGESIAYTDVVFDLGGEYADPRVQFRSPSTLRVTGRGHDLSLNVNVPLDNVVVGRYGVEGRLQAILQGNTPQFSDLDLRLDGQAYEFIAGITSIFDIRSNHNPLYRAQDFVANRWEWNLSGKGIAKALNTAVNIKGKGFWRNDHVEIQQLEGYSGAIHTAGIHIPKAELKLSDNLRWYYEEQKLQGKMRAVAPYIELDYGGRLVKPDFTLSLEGKDITDFNLAGELTAGELGPIKIFSHYYDQKLVGNIYWLEQSANVFQSLFPQKWNWIIQNGTIRGQTAFDITAESGIRMGGHFAIRAGEISLPDGGISGIEFALPYRYVNDSVELVKNPVQVFVKRIKNGVLELENLRVKVQGYYPYSRRNPLNLSELSVDLLGGRLSIKRLALPQRKAANLHLQQIDLQKVLELLQYKQLEMKGKVNAIFPFWLQGKQCVICNGKISQADEVSIKLTDEMVKGLKQGGWTESILVDVISAMDLQQLEADVNLAPDGVMQLKARIKGYNPNKKTQHPITLNYNHRENVYELWELIDYSSQFEQQLEHSIYQRLEK